MFNKLLLIIAFSLYFIPTKAVAQGGDFCSAVNVILRDAPNQFKNVRGNISETSVNLAIFQSAIKVPGTINSRFVFSMGKFYEGALIQSKNLADIKVAYEKYKKILHDCLTPKGLNMNQVENINPGMSEYKKITFMRPYNKEDDVKSLKGHVSMEVDYNKNAQTYTLLLFIFEH